MGTPHFLPFTTDQSDSEYILLTVDQFFSLLVSRGAINSESMNWLKRCPATVQISAVGLFFSAANRLNSLPWSSTSRSRIFMPVSFSNSFLKSLGIKLA